MHYPHDHSSPSDVSLTKLDRTNGDHRTQWHHHRRDVVCTTSREDSPTKPCDDLNKVRNSNGNNGGPSSATTTTNAELYTLDFSDETSIDQLLRILNLDRELNNRNSDSPRELPPTSKEDNDDSLDRYSDCEIRRFNQQEIRNAYFETKAKLERLLEENAQRDHYCS